jgi:hypothetical protein
VADTQKLMGLGKLIMMWQQQVNARKLGFEFTWDKTANKTHSRFAFSDKIDDQTSLKVKVDQSGMVNPLIKHQISKNLTLSATGGVSLVNWGFEKTRPTPLGLQFDFKF